MTESAHGSTPPAVLRRNERRDFLSYVFGAIGALVLTLVPFALVNWHRAAGSALLYVIGILALIQMAVHFRFFLHIGLRRKREDLFLILFTALLLVLMVGGTVWVMANLASRMGLPPSP